MTTEQLKIIISAEAEDAIRDLNTVKKGVDDLGNTTGTDKLKSGFVGNTQAAAQLNDQLQSLRTMSFTGLIAQVTQLGSQFSNYRDIMKEYKQTLGNRQTILGGIDPSTGKAFADARKQASAYHSEMEKGIGLLKDAKEQGNGMFYALEHGAGKVLVAIAAVVAAITALVGAIRAGFSTAQRLTSSFYEAQKVGMSVASYQEWTYIMGKVGVEADKLSDFIKGLSAAQNDLRDGTEDMVKAFDALGLSAEEAAGMSQEQLFSETVKRLQQVENQVERTSIAYRIFGEDDAADLTNVLNLNNQEMERMINNFYLLGGSASDSAVQKSRMLSASVSNLKLAWQGFTNSIGEAIMPALTAIVDALTKAVVAVNLFVRTVFGFDLVSKGTKTTIEGTSVSLDGYTGSLESATAAAEQLKRTTQGFDELNIVSNPNSSAGAGGGGSTGGGGGGSSLDIPSIDYEGLTKDLGLEKMTKWFEENAEEIKKWTGIVAGATAAWELFRLGFFLTTGKNITIFTTIGLAIKGIEKAIKGIVSGKFIGWLGTAITLLKEGNSLWAVLVATFPKLAKLSAIGKVFSSIGAAISGAAKAVGGFVGGLTSGTIIAIVAIVAALASAVYFCVVNWKELGQAVKNFFADNIAPKLETISAMFSAMGGALQEVWAALLEIGVTIWNAFPEPVQEVLYNMGQGIKELALGIWDVIVAIGEWIVSIDWLNVIGTAFEWLGGLVMGILGGVIGGAINGVMSMIMGLVEMVTGAVQLISGIVSGLVNLIVALFTGDLSKAKDSAELIWDGIVNIFKGGYDLTIGAVVELVEGIIDWFVEMWDVLVGHSIVPDMVEAIIDWFFKLPGELLGMIGQFVKDVIDWFSSMAKQAGQWAGSMWNNIKQPFLGVANWFKDIFKKALDGVKSIFSGIGSWFKTNVVTPITNVFSDIGSKIGKAVEGTFSKAVNTILKTAVSIINGFIGAINSAISLINEIPGVSIKKLDKLEVPKLATGGIVMGETLARIGEGGKREAVLPLDQNTGWMDMLADRIASRSSAPTKVVLMVNERELGWASINGINGITKQTGGIQLQLV